MSILPRIVTLLGPLPFAGLLVGSAVVLADDKPVPGLPASYIKESPLPEGFPPPGPVGEVVEKEYPVLRSYSAAGPGAFMNCFGYLSRHKHEMTAPVVMEASSDARPVAAVLAGSPIAVDRMHFLLEKASLDEPKTEGVVIVADMPRLRVLSVAFQGSMSPDVVKSAEAKLLEELKDRPEWEDAGPVRVLGYNSPFVARAKQYWEIQKPVRARARPIDPPPAQPGR